MAQVGSEETDQSRNAAKYPATIHFSQYYFAPSELNRFLCW
jgi:hypothetical protein